MSHTKTHLLSAVLLLVASLHAVAKDELDLASNPDMAQDLKIVGYTLLKGIGFTESGDNTAYTFLYRSRDDKNPRGYYASIRPKAEGPVLFFAASEPCIEGQFNHNEVIEINSQNVQAISGCTKDANKELTLGFRIKTAEGNLFALEEFKKSKVVTVRFRAMRIPFISDDFNDAWRKATQKPL